MARDEHDEVVESRTRKEEPTATRRESPEDEPKAAPKKAAKAAPKPAVFKSVGDTDEDASEVVTHDTPPEPEETESQADAFQEPTPPEPGGPQPDAATPDDRGYEHQPWPEDEAEEAPVEEPEA